MKIRIMMHSFISAMFDRLLQVHNRQDYNTKDISEQHQESKVTYSHNWPITT